MVFYYSSVSDFRKFFANFFSLWARRVEKYGEGSGRNVTLDVAKGIAILLVVLGHTFQSKFAVFDDFLGFRIIYSFHMPLFAMLAGASAKHWAGRLTLSSSWGGFIHASAARLARTSVHLLIPFVVWSILAFYLRGADEGFFPYLLKVFKKADYSLWFLPCIFWCSTYLVVFGGVFESCAACFPKLNQLPLNKRNLFKVVFVLFVWFVIKRKIGNFFGLEFANGFHGGLFVFFLLGMLCFEKISSLSKLLLRAIPYVVFLALVPFWHRTTQYNISADFLGLGFPLVVVKWYAFVVALSGSLVFVDLARLIAASDKKILIAFVCYLGASSLGIYALHFYFIDLFPPVLGAVAISVLIYVFLSRVSIVKTALFGIY